MAKEIHAYAPAGSTVYAQVRRPSDSKIWNTSGTPAFETYATANIANYAIAMTQEGSASGSYVADFPSAILVGDYDLIAFIRAGGSPAESDIVAGTQNDFPWSGAAYQGQNAFLNIIAGYIDTEVAAIKAKTDLINTAAFWTTAFTANSGSTYSAAVAGSVVKEIADNAATATATITGIANGILDLTSGIETGLTLRQATRLVVAASAGKLSGGNTTTVTIRNVVDSKNRIIATVDQFGNRSAFTYDLT